MSSCFGWCGSHDEEDEREPLLPRYRDDTVLQRELHQKLHSYQMLRALSKGFMPSNQQTITNLRALLAADVLNPDGEELSEPGRALAYYIRAWLSQFIELLQHKNNEDQIQDFIWYLSKARLEVDYEDIANRASKAKSRANIAVAYQSLQTVGSLLLTNSDFRVFLSDLNTIGREVFRDTAFTLSEASKQAGKQIEPSESEMEALKHPGSNSHPVPNQEDLGREVAEVSSVVAEGAAKVAQRAEQSFIDKVSGSEKDELLDRLRRSVSKLRNRKDYSDSVSTLSLLLKRYLLVYSHAVEDTIQTAEEDVSASPETERALRNFWTFLTSFGDASQWEELEDQFKRLMESGRSDPQFDKLVREIGNAVQEMLTDPEFFDHAEERFQKLREKSQELTSESSLREEIEGLLVQLQKTFQNMLQDQDIAKLIQTSTRIGKILSPAGNYVNSELVSDSISTFVPLLAQALQYVPIPRLEISTPDIDLLLENLILEPGRTINNTSFLPYKLRVETRNDLEICKARARTTSSVQSLMTVKVHGLSIAADEVGFWMRAHSGFLRFADQGIASFYLVERGIDVELDIEVGRDRLDKILSLRAARVRVHRLDYTLRKSRFAFCAWLLKPLIRPLVRRTLERQMAEAIAAALHAVNRELLYARERLRATRIADPDDLWTFVRAVAARLVPEEDPDLYTRVGVEQPGRGVFRGVYAPGSIVKLWDEEAARAGDRIREYEREGWRNNIFDVLTE